MPWFAWFRVLCAGVAVIGTCLLIRAIIKHNEIPPRPDEEESCGHTEADDHSYKGRHAVPKNDS